MNPFLVSSIHPSRQKRARTFYHHQTTTQQPTSNSVINRIEKIFHLPWEQFSCVTQVHPPFPFPRSLPPPLTKHNVHKHLNYLNNLFIWIYPSDQECWLLTTMIQSGRRKLVSARVEEGRWKPFLMLFGWSIELGKIPIFTGGVRRKSADGIWPGVGELWRDAAVAVLNSI